MIVREDQIVSRCSTALVAASPASFHPSKAAIITAFVSSGQPSKSLMGPPPVNRPRESGMTGGRAGTPGAM